MDDKTFRREQVRRDLQETLNELDKASTLEGNSKEQLDADTMWVLKVTMLSLSAKSLIKDFLGDKVKKDELG